MLSPRALVKEPHRRVQLRGRLLAPWWRRRFAQFGEGSVLHRPQWLVGAHEVAIGSRVLILEGAWIAAEKGAWGSGEPAIEIGDDVAINRGVMISAAQKIVVEDNVLMASGVTIIDSDHTMDGPHLNPAYNPLLSAPSGSAAGRGSRRTPPSCAVRRSVSGASSVPTASCEGRSRLARSPSGLPLGSSGASAPTEQSRKLIRPDPYCALGGHGLA